MYHTNSKQFFASDDNQNDEYHTRLVNLGTIAILCQYQLTSNGKAEKNIDIARMLDVCINNKQ